MVDVCWADRYLLSGFGLALAVSITNLTRYVVYL